VLPAAWRHFARYEIGLPPGWKPAELPPDAKLKSDFGTLKITRRFEAGRLVVEKLLEMATTRVAAADYARFRDFCLRVDRLEARRIYLQAAGRKAIPGPAPHAETAGGAR
jgi:hypothetical protein